MGRFACTLVLLTGLAASARAGAPDYVPEKAKDFATTSIGPVLVHYFPIQNTSKETINLGTVRIGCGCVAATLLKNKLAPGETTYVAAYMDTKKIPTHQRNTFKTVTVTVPFLNPIQEEVVLKVSCVAREDLFFSPDSFAFGTVQKSAGGKSSIKVTLYNQPKWEITEAKSTGKFVKVDAKEVSRQGAEVSYQVTATLDADCPAGNWMSEVFLAGNAAGMSKIRIPVTVQVAEPIAVSPSEVKFGDLPMSEKPSSQQVMLTGKDPFKILEVNVPDGAVTVTQVTDGTRASHVLKVNLAAGAEGEVKRSIEIVTDSKTQPKLIVPVSALIRK
jgi:hypothetical protein